MLHFAQVFTGTQQAMLLRAMTEMNVRLEAEGKPTLRLLDVIYEVLARGIGPDVRFGEPAGPASSASTLSGAPESA
ncbi:hypothetical protein [Azospirillum sp.]|uniref:hypothetical protein n=1 Tax=Azospirillum sp. TaxID=34012 RepID=UPI003D765E6D